MKILIKRELFNIDHNDGSMQRLLDVSFCTLGLAGMKIG